MSSTLNTIKSVIKKDLLIELRALHGLSSIISLGLLIAFVFRLCCGQMDSNYISAAVILVSILFATVLICERSFAIEIENDSLSALLMAVEDSGDLYLAKLIVNTIILFVFEVVFFPCVFILFKLPIGINFFELVLIILLINVGTASIATIFAAMVQGANAGNTLLSILAMAAFLPMIIPATESLSGVFEGGGLKNLAGMLAAFDAIFVTISWLLFDFVVSD